MSAIPQPGSNVRPIFVDETEARRAELQKAWLAAGGSIRAVGQIVDIENKLILHSAQSSYISGIDVGAVIAAHASCERDLLIRASHWVEEGEREPRKGFKLWGLGKLLEHYGSDIPSNLLSKLEALNIRRRTLYHYGHSETESGVSQSINAYVSRIGYGRLADEYERLGQRHPSPKEVHEFACALMLRSWALEALEAAYAVRVWVSH